MKEGYRKAAILAAALVLCSMSGFRAEAAKPADKGGGNSGSSTESVAGPIPEFYRIEFDHLDRTLTLHGARFITGSSGAPVFPTELTIGGKTVLIDPTSTNATASVAATDFATGEGPLILGFDDVITALEGTSPGLQVVEGERNFGIKIVTVEGVATFSAFFPQDIKEVPLDTGVCPCTFAIYTAELGDAQPGTIFCSAAEGIPTDQYIEAGYGKIDAGGNASAVIMGSHSSGSPEPLYESSCYVRDLSQIVNGVETPVYREGPIAIGNGDHQLCVAVIEALESACSP